MRRLIKTKILSFPIVFCLTGLMLMLGVILYSEEINRFFPANKPAIVEAAPVETSIIAETIPTTQAATEPTATIPDEVAIAINDPRNYRVVPKDIMPGQAILEGKTIKFLLGF